MSQFSGAFTVEVDLDRLADEIADRVLARLHQAAREATHDGYQVVPPRLRPGRCAPNRVTLPGATPAREQKPTPAGRPAPTANPASDGPGTRRPSQCRPSP